MQATSLSSLSRSTLHPNTVIWLDFLRFLCALIVTADHVFGWCPCSMHGPAPGPVATLVFFMLSGFLIVHTIHNKISTQSYNFTSFFIDRFCRIYPAYAAALVFIAIIDNVSNTNFLIDNPAISHSGGTFFANLYMLQKIPFYYDIFAFRVLPIYGSASQFWSIPPEWWMYMFIGYAAFSVRWKKITWWRILILCLLAYVPTNFLIVGNFLTGVGITAVWLFGAIVYVLYRNVHLDVTNRAHVILLMLGLVIFSFSAAMRYYLTLNVFDTLGAFSLSGVFYCCAWISRMRFMNFITRPLLKTLCRFGANYSFSLYLTHYSINVFLSNMLPAYLIFIICNVFAIGFAYLFERKHKELAAYVHARVAAESNKAS